MAFAGVPSDALLMRLDLEGIAASAGSACAAGSLEPSHVAAALGLDDRHRLGVIRFSLGRTTTAAEIDAVAASLARSPGRRPHAAVRYVRQLSGKAPTVALASTRRIGFELRVSTGRSFWMSGVGIGVLLIGVGIFVVCSSSGQAVRAHQRHAR